MKFQTKKSLLLNNIFFGFFEEDNFKISNMELKNINFELNTHNDNLYTSLNLLPIDAWILCQIIKINRDHTFINIKILISGNLKIKTDTFPNMMLVDNLKNLYLGWGNLTNILLNNNLFLNQQFKSEGMIGIAFISVKKLKEFKSKQNLLKTLPKELILEELLPHLTEEELLHLRLTSKELKRLVDLKRSVVIRNIPNDFDFSKQSIELLCNRFDKDCILSLDFKIKVDQYETLYIENSNLQSLFRKGIDDVTTNLKDSTIQKYLKISCETSFKSKFGMDFSDRKLNLMHNCISSLQNIVTLDIDFDGNWLIKDIGSKFLKMFSESSITSLKISNVFLLWKPFFHSMKHIKSLKKLILSNVTLLNDLSSINISDSEESNPEEFNKTFIDSLSGLISFGISGISEFDDDTNIVSLNIKVLPLLQYLSHLKSLQIQTNPDQDMDHLAPELSYLTKLTSLNLSNSNLYFEKEAESLVYILKNLINITSLNLSNTELNGKNLSILIPIIRSLPRLKSLDVSNNMLSKKDIQYLTRQLLYKKLTELNTANNMSEEQQENVNDPD